MSLVLAEREAALLVLNQLLGWWAGWLGPRLEALQQS